MLPGLGAPVRIKSTVLSTSGVRSSSWSLIRSPRPLKAHIRREWCWRGAMRRNRNSFTTLGVVTPIDFKNAKRCQTKASRGLSSVSWPQPELGTAGEVGFDSRGPGTPTSTYSHRSRNPTEGEGSPKSIPEAAVSDAATKLTHVEHWVESTRRREKKWRSKATDGAIPIIASQTKAKTERRAMDSGPRCIIWIW